MAYAAELTELKLHKKGKVRDVYEMDDKLLIVATDRISCFDFVLPTPITDKGKILNKISLFWFSFLKDVMPNHIVSADVKDLPDSLGPKKEDLRGRFVIAKKCKVVPFECVVRGYLSGSGWKEYQKTGKVCGIALPKGLKESDKLPEPIFTPATKADVGHDENVDFAYMERAIGKDMATKLRDSSLAIYKKCAEYALKKGIIIADTKFEFGIKDSQLILIDEVLTPDSSRFWPKDQYKPGGPQFSYDKQFVRDWLESSGWDKNPPVPQLPKDIVAKTREKYLEALFVLSGQKL